MRKLLIEKYQNKTTGLIARVEYTNTYGKFVPHIIMDFDGGEPAEQKLSNEPNTGYTNLEEAQAVVKQKLDELGLELMEQTTP